MMELVYMAEHHFHIWKFKYIYWDDDNAIWSIGVDSNNPGWLTGSLQDANNLEMRRSVAIEFEIVLRRFVKLCYYNVLLKIK